MKRIHPHRPGLTFTRLCLVALCTCLCAAGCDDTPPWTCPDTPPPLDARITLEARTRDAWRLSCAVINTGDAPLPVRRLHAADISAMGLLAVRRGQRTYVLRPERAPTLGVSSGTHALAPGEAMVIRYVFAPDWTQAFRWDSRNTRPLPARRVLVPAARLYFLYPLPGHAGFIASPPLVLP